jgi:hypothetical protein
MNDEEIDRLITELREMLFRSGFGWAAVEAEESLYPTVTPRTRALALITAAEIVTVDLAAVEMAADDVLGGQGIRFKPDEAGRDYDEDAFALRDRGAVDFEAEPLLGPQRRAVLADLSARGEVFAVLRSRLDGLV